MIPYRQLAFTLLELLIVIAIIAALTALILATSFWFINAARETATTKRMEQILQAAQAYGGEGQQAATALQAVSGAFPWRFTTLRESLANISDSSLWTYKNNNEQLVPNAIRCWENGGTTSSGNKSFYDLTASVAFMPNTGDTSKGLNDRMRSAGLPGDPSRIGESLDGTVDIFPDQTLRPNRPTTDWYRTRWPMEWPATDWDNPTPGSIPPIWGSPWGLPDWERQTITVAGSTTWWYTLNRTNAPATRTLAELSPLSSLKLLQALQVVTPDAAGQTDYRQNRSSKRDWNDAWGSPLVVVMASYLPPRHDTPNNGRATPNFEFADTNLFNNEWFKNGINSYCRQRDALLNLSFEAYTYRRSVYLAIASPGQKLNSAVAAAAGSPAGSPVRWAPAADATVLRALWKQVSDTCAVTDWKETWRAKKPWNGVRTRTSAAGLHGMVTEPAEVK